MAVIRERAAKRLASVASAAQVINHGWSRKLNYDIIAPVAAPGAGDRSNGDAAAQQKRPLPCWDWLHAAAERSVAEAQQAWADARARDDFAAHGWSLPYPYQEVKRVRHAAGCHALADPVPVHCCACVHVPGSAPLVTGSGGMLGTCSQLGRHQALAQVDAHAALHGWLRPRDTVLHDYSQC